MSDNKIHTLGRIDQAIRGINDDGTDDGYIPPQSENGALERIEKSIKAIDIKGIKSGLPKVTNKDNDKILKVINGKWGKGDDDAGISAIQQPASYYLNNYRDQSSSPDIFMVYGKIEENVRKNESVSAASNNIYTDPANSELEGYESWRAFHDDDSNGWCTDNSRASLIYKFNVVTVLQSMSFRIKWVGPLLNNHRCDGIRLYYKNSDNEWAGNIPIADYTISAGSPAGYKDFEVTFSSPISPKGEVKIFLNGFEMVPEDEIEVKFSIQNVIFKGYKASVQTDSKDYGCSIWYRGACYGNVSEGGGQRTKTLLYDSNGLGTPNDIVTQLSDSIINYDQIMIIISDEFDYSEEHGGPLYMASYIIDVDIATEAIINWSGYSERYVNMNFSGLTSFTNSGEAPGENSSYRPSVYKIYGIKY